MKVLQRRANCRFRLFNIFYSDSQSCTLTGSGELIRIQSCYLHMPFSKVEALLSSEHFLKIHRSYLVNCEYVAGIENGELTLKNGRTLPVSKYRINEVMNSYLSYIESCNLE